MYVVIRVCIQSRLKKKTKAEFLSSLLSSRSERDSGQTKRAESPEWNVWPDLWTMRLDIHSQLPQ